VLADEAYAIAALRMPWGNYDSGTACSPVGATVVASVGASHCEATRAARRHSIHACRERWSERHRRRGAEGPAASTWVGVDTGRDGDRPWPR
jgi:hypothetical protein